MLSKSEIMDMFTSRQWGGYKGFILEVYDYLHNIGGGRMNTKLFNILKKIIDNIKGLQVEDISDQITFTPAWTNMHTTAYKIGNVVFFTLEGTATTIVANYQYTIATIANGYKPKRSLPFTGHGTDSNFAPLGIVNAWVWTSGDITIRCSNANGNYIFVSGFYCIE